MRQKLTRLTKYSVVARLRPVLIGAAIIGVLAASTLYQLQAYDHTRAQLALSLISATVFSLWFLRILYVYSLRLEVDGEYVVIKRLGWSRLLRKRTIQLTKVTTNGLIRAFKFKSDGTSFAINENFHNAAVFVSELEKEREKG